MAAFSVIMTENTGVYTALGDWLVLQSYVVLSPVVQTTKEVQEGKRIGSKPFSCMCPLITHHISYDLLDMKVWTNPRTQLCRRRGPGVF